MLRHMLHDWFSFALNGPRSGWSSVYGLPKTGEGTGWVGVGYGNDDPGFVSRIIACDQLRLGSFSALWALRITTTVTTVIDHKVREARQASAEPWTDGTALGATGKRLGQCFRQALGSCLLDHGWGTEKGRVAFSTWIMGA